MKDHIYDVGYKDGSIAGYNLAKEDLITQQRIINEQKSEIAELKLQLQEKNVDPATAAIQYALEHCEDDDDSLAFLRNWNAGDFQILRDNWTNIPNEVFIGADPQFKPDPTEIDVPQYVIPR